MSGTQQYPNGQGSAAGAIPVYLAAGPAGASGFTPRAAAASAIVTGGTAIVAISGPCNGGFITNPSIAAAQGISATENGYVDMVAAPGATDAGANGTTILLAPGQSFTVPPLATGVSVRLNAATTGHKFSIEVW